MPRNRVTLPPPATASEHLKSYALDDDYAVPPYVRGFSVGEFVYVMQGTPGTPIKVGRAKHPLKRLATFQTSQWQTIYLLYVIPGGVEMERSLHYCLRDSRIRGEWFECDRDFLVWVHDFAEYAFDHYVRTRELVKPPVTPPPPKQAKRPHLSKRRKATTVYHA